jgi:hypothetical protein
MSEFKPSDILWCQRTFALMDLGGIWGIPRCGLIFRKESASPPLLKLVGVLPHAVEMPMSAEELLAFQREELAVTKRAFKEAGITIEGEVE